MIKLEKKFINHPVTLTQEMITNECKARCTRSDFSKWDTTALKERVN